MPLGDKEAVKVKNSNSLQIYGSKETVDSFRNEWADWSKEQRKLGGSCTQNSFLSLLLEIYEIYKFFPKAFKALADNYNNGIFEDDLNEIKDSEAKNLAKHFFEMGHTQSTDIYNGHEKTTFEEYFKKYNSGE